MEKSRDVKAETGNCGPSGKRRREFYLSPQTSLISRALLNSASVFQILCVCVFWDKRGPPSPQEGQLRGAEKERKKGGGRGRRELRGGGVLFAQLHPNHLSPSVLVTVGWGSRGLAAGPCLTPNAAPQSPHGPHLDQPICLIINEQIQAVSEHSAAHAATGPRQCAPVREALESKRSDCKQGET